MAIDPTEKEIEFTITTFGAGYDPGDLFTVRYSENNGASFDFVAGKSLNTSDYQDVQIGDSNFGLFFEATRTCYVSDLATHLKIDVTTGDCATLDFAENTIP